jgi:hypothetical protein
MVSVEKNHYFFHTIGTFCVPIVQLFLIIQDLFASQYFSSLRQKT